MKLRKQQGNIHITSEGKNLLIMLSEVSSIENYDSVVNLTPKKYQSNKVISTPGEYEIGDVLFSVYNVDGDLDRPGVAVMDTDEDIKVVFVGVDVDKISKGMMEIMGDTSVLIMQIDNEKISKQLEKVSEIEPYIFIPLIDKSKISDLEKQMGIGNVETLSVLKISQKEFTDESADTRVYILES